MVFSSLSIRLSLYVWFGERKSKRVKNVFLKNVQEKVSVIWENALREFMRRYRIL